MKVQVANKQVVDTLQHRLMRGVEDYIPKSWTKRQRDTFRARMGDVCKSMFDAIHQNIQIGGVDWENADKTTEAIEPVNDAAQLQLTNLLVEVNALIVDVAAKRKSVPSEVEAMVCKMIEAGREADAACAPSALAPPVAEHTSIAGASIEELEKVLAMWQDSMSSLATIRKTMPDVVHRARRIAKVAELGPKFDASATENVIREPAPKSSPRPTAMGAQAEPANENALPSTHTPLRRSARRSMIKNLRALPPYLR